MNGLLLQDNSKENRYANRYLALYSTGTDSLHFNNLYYNSSNKSALFSAAGKKLPVVENNNMYENTAWVPKNQKAPFIFYENSVYRWPPVFINVAPYYFFLKYPLQITSYFLLILNSKKSLLVFLRNNAEKNKNYAYLDHLTLLK